MIPYSSSNRSLWIVLPIIFAASIFGINQYQFGQWNQYISLPWLYDMLNPELYPNEIIVDQRENSPSLFLYLIKGFVSLMGNNIPLAFFLLYAVSHFLTLIGFYKLTHVLFKSDKASLLATVMLAFAFPVIGDIQVWSSYLMERTIAYPLLVFSLVYILKNRMWPAIILQAIAFNIHPLSSLYLIGASWLGILFSRGLKKELFGYAIVFSILAAPVLYLKFSLPETTVSSELQALWLQVMKLRNAHHALPSAFPILILLKSLAIAIAYFVFIKYSMLDVKVKRFFTGFGVAIGVMLVIGTIFTEFYPVKLILQFQFFRSFKFLVLLTFVLFCGLSLTQNRPLYLLMIPLIFFQYVQDEPTKGIAAIAVTAFIWFTLNLFKNEMIKNSIVATTFAIVGILAFVGRGGFSINEPNMDNDWKDLQQWVAQNTSEDVIVIVPPQEPGFRVIGKRSSYGDWYDGTKAFFSEEYAKYWYNRMESLGCTDPTNLKEDYLKNEEIDFLKIAQELSENHSQVLVASYDNSDLEFPVHYNNSSFKLYAVQ